MNTSTEPGVLGFLIKPENLPNVLEIIGHTEEIREKVAQRFWGGLRTFLKQHQPEGQHFNFGWSFVDSLEPVDDFRQAKRERWFGLEARLTPADKKTQGLRYAIEAGQDWFGFGLAWLKTEAGNFKDLCKRRPLENLQNQLKKHRRGDIEAEPDSVWFWREYWTRNPYIDPWSWFATEFDDAWYKHKADTFWEFVAQTHASVVEANKALKGG